MDFYGEKPELGIVIGLEPLVRWRNHQNLAASRVKRLIFVHTVEPTMEVGEPMSGTWHQLASSIRIV